MATSFHLLKIPGVLTSWETEHEIYALEVNGDCCVNMFIREKMNSDPPEFKKIMKVLNLLGTSDRVRNPYHVKPDERHSGIYELIAKKGHARISFFYSPPDEKVVCVLPYWKTTDHRKPQNSFFEKSAEIMKEYLSLS